MGNEIESKSLLDSLFGMKMPKSETPSFSYFYKKVTSTSNVEETANMKEYTATVTIPEGFNLDEIKATVDGNTLTIRVPRLKTESTTTEIPIHKS